MDIGFWSELAKRKLEVYKLSEEPVSIYGSCCICRRQSFSSPVSFDRTSFDPDHRPTGSFRLTGELYVVNTLEGFKSFNRKEAVEKSAEITRMAIMKGQIWNPETHVFLLQCFLLLVYADLKNHVFHYWCCFPVHAPSVPYTVTSRTALSDVCDDGDQFCSHLDTWMQGNDGYVSPVIHYSGISNAVTDWKYQKLSRVDASSLHQESILCLLDPCHLIRHPSWLLRNILSVVAHHQDSGTVKVRCMRQLNGKLSSTQSQSFEIAFQREDVTGMSIIPGWEANQTNKIAPRSVNLRSRFDPQQLAEEAVGLNIRLMLWRAAPDLKLEALDIRCLLIGMGTLGCCVARSLLGWGIKHLSLIDCGRVAYSNPVRQCLYEFNDCLDNGQPKASCAADRLRRIHPGIDVQSYDFQIPMPGHPPTNAQQTQSMQQATEQLHNLVMHHDVIFLLTDNRESRWLPSVIGSALNKIVICVALGYDSYLVMRHGVLKTDNDDSKLGCYFCNDIQAPMETTADLALDQQCTVARPGLAPIASALAVEMLVSVLHHPLGGAAGHGLPEEEGETSPMGGVPHMMKGSVFHFSNVSAHGLAFHQCTACSSHITHAYLQDRWVFVHSALTVSCHIIIQLCSSLSVQDPNFLQDVTGLTALLEQTDALLDQVNSDDSEFEVV